MANLLVPLCMDFSYRRLAISQKINILQRKLPFFPLLHGFSFVRH